MAAFGHRVSTEGVRKIFSLRDSCVGVSAGRSLISPSFLKSRLIFLSSHKLFGRSVALKGLDSSAGVSELLSLKEGIYPRASKNGGYRFLFKVSDAGLQRTCYSSVSSFGMLKKVESCTSRISYSTSTGDSESADEADYKESQELGESADSVEVARVCKIVEDLFASDCNMEAVLDQCEVKLSHSLVLDVLAHFRHARKPAFRFFCWASRRPGYSHCSRTYNSMMSILGKNRQFESMVEMLEEMGKKGLLTIETFEISIRAFAAARELKKAVATFELMKRYNFEAGIDTFNSLLNALGREKLVIEAQALFEKMRNRFEPNMQTYSVLLAGWCKVKNLLEAGRVWNNMIDKGLKPDIVAHNIILEGLLKGHRHSEAIKLVELMKAKGPFPNVKSYTILIQYFCKRGKMEEAAIYFDEMLTAGCQPDPAVYTCLIVGFGNEKRMDKVYGLLREMKEKGCPPDGLTYNALIKMMTSRNMPEDAIRVYKKMVKSGFEPTVHTFNMLMKSYFRMRNSEMGCAVWDEMRKSRCCPDDNSYTVLIAGLTNNGRSDEAYKYLEEMMNKGMKAPQLDYNKFVANFSRAGRPDILSELSQRIKLSGRYEDIKGDKVMKGINERDSDPAVQRF